MKNLYYTLDKYAIPWLLFHDHFSYAEAVFSSGYILCHIDCKTKELLACVL